MPEPEPAAEPKTETELELEPEVSSDSTAGRLDSAANSPACVQVVNMPLLKATLPEEHEAETCLEAEV